MASRFSSVTEEQILSINEADYSTCVVHTETNIHLSVGGSGG